MFFRTLVSVIMCR